MATKEVIFSDRLTNLSLHNGLVRIGLGVFAGTGKIKDGKDAMKVETTHQVVMPLETFANAVAAQQALLKQVVEAGRKRDAAEAEGVPIHVSLQFVKRKAGQSFAAGQGNQRRTAARRPSSVSPQRRTRAW